MRGRRSYELHVAAFSFVLRDAPAWWAAGHFRYNATHYRGPVRRRNGSDGRLYKTPRTVRFEHASDAIDTQHNTKLTAIATERIVDTSFVNKYARGTQHCSISSLFRLHGDMETCYLLINTRVGSLGTARFCAARYSSMASLGVLASSRP